MGIGTARLVLVEWPLAWSSLRTLSSTFNGASSGRKQPVTKQRVDSGAGPQVVFKQETASSQSRFVAGAQSHTYEATAADNRLYVRDVSLRHNPATQECECHHPKRSQFKIPLCADDPVIRRESGNSD